MTPEELARHVPVSRETVERLKVYADLLVRWQARINLVSAATLPELWRRHILDSAQLARWRPPGSTLVDLGSGAGFPGLVLAIMGDGPVHLIESDTRKATFLREAARLTEAPVTVHAQRIAAVTPFAADLVTARALAPLAQLLDLAEPFLAPHSFCLFLKGRGGEDELTAAAKEWTITAEREPSISDPSGLILILREVSRGRATR